MKNGVSSKAGTPLRQNHIAHKRHRRVEQPSPTGNRRQRRAYAAQQKQQDKRL
jgi:hypothetical protein